jgi:hypothetical protein
MGCVALDAKLASHSANVVPPAWRDSLIHCIVVGPWNNTVPHANIIDHKRELAEDIIAMLEKATTGCVTISVKNFWYDGRK